MRKSIIDNFVRYGLGGVPQFPRKLLKKSPGTNTGLYKKLGLCPLCSDRFEIDFFSSFSPRCDNIVTTGKRLLTPMTLLLAVYCVASHTGSIKKGTIMGKGKGVKKAVFDFFGGLRRRSQNR